MFKKIFFLSIFSLLLLLFTSCKNSNISNNQTTNNVISEDNTANNYESNKQNISDANITINNSNSNNDNNTNNNDKNNSNENEGEDEIKRFTGEIITDGILMYNNSICFVPDLETKKLIKEMYNVDIEESQYIELNDIDIVKDLPTELGIYKVEVEFSDIVDGNQLTATSIKLSDTIGTIEYKGKNYETNILDENVKVKDTVCGLIVSDVWHQKDEEGISINFEGNLDVEGYYELFNGGDIFDCKNLGIIYATNESLTNIPQYKNATLENHICTIFFQETNNLYKELENFSQVGKGVFKINNYFLNYNIGRGIGPGERIFEIVSLDNKYKSNFPTDTAASQIYESTDKYLLVTSVQKKSTDNTDKNNDENDENEDSESDDNINIVDYYIIDKETDSTIKIFSSNGFKYEYNVSSDERFDKTEMFTLTSDGFNYITNEQLPAHNATFRVLGSNQATIMKQLDFADFKTDTGSKTIYIGQQINNMNVDDIEAYYNCEQGKEDELIILNCEFSCDNIQLSGTINVSNDPQFGYFAYFTCDEESKKQLPHSILDSREIGSFNISEEIAKKLLDENIQNETNNQNNENTQDNEVNAIEKKCTITISKFNIGYRNGTECYNTAVITDIQFKE